MRRAPLSVLFGAGVLAACAPATPEQRGGIVSLNPCADQLLLALVPPQRIAAISLYSQRAASSSIPLEVARRFRATAGTAEEVIALAPDLVVASSFTPPATRAAFTRAGLHTLYLDSPVTIEASKTQITELAHAVGAEHQGRALAARIDAAVAAARTDAVPIPTLILISNDLANGSGTLLHELMNRAGLRNAAADYGLRSTGWLPVETIIARPPVLILAPESDGRTAKLRRRLLAAAGAKTHEAFFPRRLVNCGGPTIPLTLARLAELRR